MDARKGFIIMPPVWFSFRLICRIFFFLVRLVFFALIAEIVFALAAAFAAVFASRVWVVVLADAMVEAWAVCRRCKS